MDFSGFVVIAARFVCVISCMSSVTIRSDIGGF